MQIATYQWAVDTRPCDFCLCLAGGSVFADFATDAQGRVHLIRISFDGYGCCETEGRSTTMSAEDSKAVTDSIAADDVNNVRVRDVLFRYFDENRGVIWQNALTEHKCLRTG